MHWKISSGSKLQLRESAEWQETLLEEMVSNTKVIMDAMDLFTRGENFLRVREMGRLEGPEEAELVGEEAQEDGEREREGEGAGKESGSGARGGAGGCSGSGIGSVYGCRDDPTVDRI